MILLLFSGGIESTLLLKYFLEKTDTLIHILYTELNYDELSKKRIKEQTIAATNVLNYFRKNYRNFNYSTVKLDLNNINRQSHLKNGFGFDEQWNIFFGSMYAKLLGINKIWIGHFTYNYQCRQDFNLDPDNWYIDGTLEKYALAGLAFDFKKMSEIKICFPSKDFKNTNIDAIRSKKEAFDYLEPELRKLVRSCQGEDKFCGKCMKCLQYKKYGIKND